MPETTTPSLYEVIVITDGYTKVVHPFVTASDAIHYHAECKEQGFEALYVNREGDEPVVTGLLNEPIVAWTTDEMRERFSVDSFIAPLVIVQRKADGKMGTLQFTHSPRYYFAWVETS